MTITIHIARKSSPTSEWNAAAGEAQNNVCRGES